MTQPPFSPYQPPALNLPPSGPSSARRAGILLLILGGLALLAGCCGALVGGVLPQLIAEHPEITAKLPRNIPIGQLQQNLIIQSILILVMGLLLIFFGFFVIRGSKRILLPSLILTALITLYLCLDFFSTLVVGLQQDPASTLLGACLVLIPLILFILLFVWLLQAYRNPTSPMGYQQQYAQAYQYYLWQQQQYQQQSHNPAPPPPPPPPTV